MLLPLWVLQQAQLKRPHPPCRLMVKLVGCSAVCERMKENSAAGTQSVTLLRYTTLLMDLHTTPA